MKEKFENMRLAIFSDCVHLKDNNENVVTENHIFRKQIEVLSNEFKNAIIYCPFETYSDKKVVTAYKSAKIEFKPLPNVGGNRLKDKIKLISTIPVWLKACKEACKNADIVYQRFPDNLNIPAFFYFYFKKTKVFGTYTGTWKNYKGEPLTYRFQKWLLKHFFRGPVSAYISQERLGKNLFKNFSPSYTQLEWEEESGQVSCRIKKLQTDEIHKQAFICVGALVANKNQQYILDSFYTLKKKGLPFELYIVGGGELEKEYLRFIKDNNLRDEIFLTGKKTDAELRSFYRRVDFIIQASLVEGFGKVPVEGFFHGIIPILNNINLAAEITGNSDRGFLFSADKPDSLSTVVTEVLRKKEVFVKMIENGRTYARSKTIDVWVREFIKTIDNYFE